MQSKTEKVILAQIYIQNNQIGFEFLPDGNRFEVLYFLESFLKKSREAYEMQFEDTED